MIENKNKRKILQLMIEDLSGKNLSFNEERNLFIRLFDLEFNRSIVSVSTLQELFYQLSGLSFNLMIDGLKEGLILL